MKKFALLCLMLVTSVLSLGAFAEEEEVVDTYAYYGFEPDIVTN